MTKNRTILISGTYALKTQFQALLEPAVQWLITYKITANQVTLISAFLCIIYSLMLVWPTTSKLMLLMLPIFLLIRMALNALDGMIAVKTHSQSALGMVLNETGDVLSDLFLFGAFLFLLPVPLWLWVLLMLLGLIIEFISVALHVAIGERPVLGPFAKSDRALYLGLLAIFLTVLPGQVIFLTIYTLLGIGLAGLTVWNRMQLLSRVEGRC